MCPDQCQRLTETYGEEFNRLYESYEERKMYVKQVSIVSLWNLITSTQIETGKPYIMYKDHVNRKCNQNNLGVIKSSNLCVAGETPILTQMGYVAIKDCVGTVQNVWNGEKWSRAVVAMTNTNQKLVKVTMSDGSYLKCTEYHRFMIKDGNSYIIKNANELNIGDESKQCESFPIITKSYIETVPQYKNEQVPMNSRLFNKLMWIVEHLDKSAGCLQITSDDFELLYDTKLMANTLGCNPFICTSERGTHLRFSSEDANMLINELMLPTTYEFNDLANIAKKAITVVSIEPVEGTHNTFCFNEPIKHMGVFNGMLTMNCSEITIYSDENNIGVCNLASICLPKFVAPYDKNKNMFKIGDKGFDFGLLNIITQKVVLNMDKVMDNNKYPLAQAKHSDDQNRPIGVGVQGLSEVFMMMKLPYDAIESKELNRKIFETIYYASMTASNKLAQMKGKYPTFDSSMTAQGVFQFDLWGVTPSGLWDWNSLKNDVRSTGLRNSLLIALMPTAGTSIILGHTEGVEPPQSNIFTRSTLSGRFQVVNKHLIKDLKSLNLWNSNIRRQIIDNNGSVADVKEIPQNIKDVYKTIYEYKNTSFIDMCADREAYVCQSSSNNRYVTDPSISLLTKMHIYSWNKGLKTSSYYIRVKQLNTGKKIHNQTQEECLSCSA
jgi:ribonucleotide reductase alpha subunit